MRELSLFSGAGGGLLGTKLLGWTHIGYVEFNEYCQQVIAQRIKDGILDEAPIFTDVREFLQSGAAEQYCGIADVVTGGFPCQPFSVAGKGLAEDDPRNMWPATLGIIRAVRPRFCLLENVPGLLSKPYWGTILGDLAESGYDCKWKVISAAEVGAPHRRDRVWIVASSDNGLGEPEDEKVQAGRNAAGNGCSDVANPAKPRLAFRLRIRENAKKKRARLKRNSCVWWQDDPADMGNTNGFTGDEGRRNAQRKNGRARKPNCEKRKNEDVHDNTDQPFLGRVAHGVAHRVDRLKALGNGQVPAVVRAAWELLTG